MDDFQQSLALWSDPAVTRYIGGIPNGPEDVWKRLLRYAGHWAAMGFGYWAVEDAATGQYLGEAGFGDYRRDITPRIDGIPEIGWVLAPHAHGKGLATEAAAAALAWRDANLPPGPTACLIHLENAASLRVAAKLGFRFEAATLHGGEPSTLLLRPEAAHAAWTSAGACITRPATHAQGTNPMSITDTSTGKEPPHDINVVIEIPQGSNVKYEVDKDTGALVVDRFLFTPMAYPAAYGFIPGTLADDGDPADALVLVPSAIVPGAVIRVRPIGVLHMTDESGQDEKIICVPHDKVHPLYRDVKTTEDLPDIVRQSISHFFETYKDLEPGKWVKVTGFGTLEEAHAIILASIAAARPS
jgi:inorganic pyrophosphatase